MGNGIPILMKDQNTIMISVFRGHGENKNDWSLGTYHYMKDITREEGFALKNKYGFGPLNSYGFSLGYKGEVPLEELEGGKMLVNHEFIPYEADEYKQILEASA